MEMNLHMPQDVESEAELMNLAAVPYQIISPGNNTSIIGIFQDSMLGSYRFTRPNIQFSSKDAMNLLMSFNKVNVDLLNKENKDDKITNFEILSQILPPLSIKMKNKQYDGDKENPSETNNIIEIKNGTYIRGQIDKGILGSGTKGLIHRICNDFGNMASADFIDDLQNIITDYMKQSAFSVGISDLIANKQTYENIGIIIENKKKETMDLIDQLQIGIFENSSGKTNYEEFETQVNNILNRAQSEAGRTAIKSLDKDNRFLIMFNAGSKGSEINIQQMISCLGQQSVDGKRIPYGFENRTLPHFTKYDDSPNARGFVESSFINGLNPQELFFHAMGGRIGLIDTAVKSVTWETPIIVYENNRPLYIEIGKWIDNKLNEAKKEDIQYFKERNMELLNTNNIYIPTTDENGKISWGEISAITRHDPGNELYEIKTLGGRSVIVTESKSLLIWNNETKKLVETNTPEIKIGDKVPITGCLCEPSFVMNYLSLEDYLPKDKYIYGSEFNNAIMLMDNVMQNRKKITSNWWNENNGKNFILPFNKKSSLQRSKIHSNISNIRNGFIYPYHEKRNDTFIFEKFELNEENGIFLGLYIAKGNTNKYSICITNNDENIRQFVKNWFSKLNIKWRETIRKNKIGGTTTTIVGINSILAEFLRKIIGEDAENKHIPVESFVSNEKFIIGLLNGYFSGNGHISKNSLETSSASKRLIEDISLLCSRLNIFGKVFKTQLKKNNLNTQNIKSTYRFTIRSQWGQIFSEKINLIHETKNIKMKNIIWNNKHTKFDVYNDIVLDPITEINIISTTNHPKVYDLTIPSTLNFGLANGLQVRDTSSTGYIQRRLIKGLEDLMVNYDMTIRNNKNVIIQFNYGEDNIDTIKVENQNLPLIEMSIQDIYSHFNIIDDKLTSKSINNIFVKSIIPRMKKQTTDYNIKAKYYTDYLIQKRDEIIKNIFNFKSNSVVSCPVAFSYIIENVIGQQNINRNSIVDLTLLEALEMIEYTYSKLETIYYASPTELFKVLYYFYLSPKDLLINKRFNKTALQILLETILLDYKRAIIAPGEMVGMIAAQSIGEPTTQLTLNSFVYETELLVRDINKNIHKVKIGEFVEKLIKYGKENLTKMEYYQDKDTTYAPTLENEYWEIQAPDEDGNVNWYKIEAGTQHPVINEDGTNTMLKVITEDEQEVIATKTKSFLILKDRKLVATRGDELKVGNYLPISTKQIEHNQIYELNLKNILPPCEYLYGSEVYKAMAYWDEHQWWKNHHNIDFTLPYKTSNTLRDRMKQIRKGNKSRVQIENGYIYPKKTSKNSCKLPEIIPLDYDFGFLIGSYCAEGCITKTQISISNNDFNYHIPIQRWCERFNITTKQYKNENKIKDRWTSSDIRIYSIVLTELIEKLCGKLSHGKFISEKLIFSNDEFKKGFINAYIGGDGSLNIKSKQITIFSVSYELLSNFSVMLKTLDIFSYIRKNKKQTSNNRGTKSENIKQGYTLCLRNTSMIKLATILQNNEINYKAENARQLMNYIPKSKYSIYHDIIPNLVNNEINIIERNDDIMKDTIFRKIKSIEEVPNTTNYAYDLTIETTRNFVIINGLEVRDTFHLAGVASKSNVTRGVPRIEEILSLTENIKNPSLTIYLKPEDQTNKDKANTIQYMIEHTKLKEVVKSCEICFDPDDMNTLIEEDKLTMTQYKEFENLLEECLNQQISDEQNEKSKWILRMEMDAEVMLEKNITMDDINFTLHNVYNDEISCVYSDFNSDKLIFRIRMINIIKNSNKKKSKNIPNPLDQLDQIYVLKNFQEQLLNNIVLRGIKNINKVIVRKIKDNLVENSGTYNKEDIWVLDTIGTNLLDVLGLDYIDTTRTISNDISEIYNVLGMEAARQTIYNEFVEVIEFDGGYINHHHISLLCDRMTYSNKMVSIFRHGINNDNIGPIAKASFEETPEQFLKAARHGELDMMRGISANVMVGQEGYYGTSAFQVLLDIETMIKFEEKIQYEYVDTNKIIEDSLYKQQLEMSNDNSLCSSNNLTIYDNVDNIIVNNDKNCINDYNPFA